MGYLNFTAVVSLLLGAGAELPMGPLCQGDEKGDLLDGVDNLWDYRSTRQL